jgi:hypothetical protein
MVSHAVNNFADNGFSKDVWTNILRDFNEGSNQKLAKPQLQSKLAILKKKYLSFQKMKNNSGWGWNEDLGHPDCDDLAWSEWIDTHKDCAEFKQNGVWESFPWYNEMDFIFSGNTASGARVRDAGAPSVDITLNSSFSDVNSEEDFQCHFRSPIIETNVSPRSDECHSSTDKVPSIVSEKKRLPTPIATEKRKKAKNGAFAIAASIDEYTKTFAPKSTSSSSSLHNVRNDITKKIESLKERSDYFRNLTGRETFKLKLQVSKPENLEWFLAFDDEECEGFAEEFLRRDI